MQARLRRLTLADHDLLSLSSLNAAPLLEHVTVSGSFSLHVDAADLTMPRLETLLLADTYQRAPEDLPSPLYVACPSLRRVTLEQSAGHLEHAWSVRRDLDLLQLDTHRVQPTFAYADAVRRGPTVPDAASPLHRAASSTGRALKRYVFSPALRYTSRVGRKGGLARVSVRHRHRLPVDGDTDGSSTSESDSEPPSPTGSDTASSMSA